MVLTAGGVLFTGGLFLMRYGEDEILWVDMIPCSPIMDDIDGNEQRMLSSKQYETFAQWLERVALLFLASFVVGSIAKGLSVTDPVVLIGGVVTVSAYYLAVYLMIKS
ncbi:MAG: hypothetical protein WAP52_01920 [Candidatus Sungiibacteriota bacterium]